MQEVGNVTLRAHQLNVHRWLDRYTKRLTELPGRTEPITETNWQQALGGGRGRVGDWTAYFTRQFAERPWREVLTDAAWSATAAITAAYAPASPPG